MCSGTPNSREQVLRLQAPSGPTKRSCEAVGPARQPSATVTRLPRKPKIHCLTAFDRSLPSHGTRGGMLPPATGSNDEAFVTRLPTGPSYALVILVMATV